MRTRNRWVGWIWIVCPVAILLALALTGCATIREHPRLAAAAAGIAVTSIALSTNHRDYQPAPDIRLPIPPARELAR